MKDLNQPQNDKLVAVLCGMPFSGTTFLSRIICGHKKIDSGFECGMLFEESPREFIKRKKFFGWMMSHERPYNWKLTEEEMSYICDTEDFYEAYSRITEKCHLYSEDVNRIVDKTPAYIYRLRGIMTKVDRTPFIVVQKDPDFQYSSYKNRGRTLEEFSELYKKQMESIHRVQNRPVLNKRLLVINFRDLNENLEESIEKLFAHIQKFTTLKYDHESMVDSIIKNTTLDIKSNRKKLRKKFDYHKEKELFDKSFTPFEKEKLNHLREFSISLKS